MGLLREMMRACVRLAAVETADGRGGYGVEWAEGAGFDALVLRQGASGAVEGQRREAAERFRVVVDAGVVLAERDVFRRVDDGAVFRVVAPTRDRVAPGFAEAICERWDEA